MRNEHEVSARKVEGVLSMPGLHFLLPLLTLCCYEAGKVRKTEQGEVAEGHSAWNMGESQQSDKH